MKVYRIKIQDYGHREHVWGYYPTNQETNIRVSDFNNYNSSDSIHYIFRRIVSVAKISIR